jgi:hypothetical protein
LPGDQRIDQRFAFRGQPTVKGDAIVGELSLGAWSANHQRDYLPDNTPRASGL